MFYLWDLYEEYLIFSVFNKYTDRMSPSSGGGWYCRRCLYKPAPVWRWTERSLPEPELKPKDAELHHIQSCDPESDSWDQHRNQIRFRSCFKISLVLLRKLSCVEVTVTSCHKTKEVPTELIKVLKMNNNERINNDSPLSDFCGTGSPYRRWMRAATRQFPSEELQCPLLHEKQEKLVAPSKTLPLHMLHVK